MKKTESDSGSEGRMAPPKRVGGGGSVLAVLKAASVPFVGLYKEVRSLSLTSLHYFIGHPRGSINRISRIRDYKGSHGSTQEATFCCKDCRKVIFLRKLGDESDDMWREEISYD